MATRKNSNSIMKIKNAGNTVKWFSVSNVMSLEKVNPLGKICRLTFVFHCLNKGCKSVHFQRLASI